MNKLVNLLIKIGSALLIALIWLMVIPNMCLVFPITGRFLHEYEFTEYPYIWFNNN